MQCYRMSATGTSFISVPIWACIDRLIEALHGLRLWRANRWLRQRNAHQTGAAPYDALWRNRPRLLAVSQRRVSPRKQARLRNSATTSFAAPNKRWNAQAMRLELQMGSLGHERSPQSSAFRQIVIWRFQGSLMSRHLLA